MYSFQGQSKRRQLLKALFLGAGASGLPVFLSACGSGGSAAASAVLPTVGPAQTGVMSGAESLASILPLKPGPLAAIPDLVTADLDGFMIPAGFRLRSVARHFSNPVTGLPDPVGASGYNWHFFPDGGAVFPTEDGGWVYVSNSENEPGGAGALRFDKTGAVTSAYPILTNTRRNCAGGATPWGTWLSCEETPDGVTFECDPAGMGTARALPALGLFNHEAAAVDLPTQTVFLTEDAGDGRLYRFKSQGPTMAVNGRVGLDMARGRLQVLEIDGFEAGAYPEKVEDVVSIRRVKWVDVINPQMPQSTVRTQLASNMQKAPGTVFKGGEGIWIHDVPNAFQVRPSGAGKPMRAVMYFACKGDNRVYALDIDNDLIELVFDNRQLAANEGFDDVDNLVVGPFGDVIVAEDGEGMRLMVMIPNQPAKILVKCTLGGSELAGPAFTPDGSRLYFSSQRGPNLPVLPGLSQPTTGTGATYELLIPEKFRKLV